MLDTDYLFYLAFENSICDDYVTEKLYSALRRNIIPVVFGERTTPGYCHHIPTSTPISSRQWPTWPSTWTMWAGIRRSMLATFGGGSTTAWPANHRSVTSAPGCTTPPTSTGRRCTAIYSPGGSTVAACRVAFSCESGEIPFEMERDSFIGSPPNRVKWSEFLSTQMGIVCFRLIGIAAKKQKKQQEKAETYLGPT